MTAAMDADALAGAGGACDTPLCAAPPAACGTQGLHVARDGASPADTAPQEAPPHSWALNDIRWAPHAMARARGARAAVWERACTGALRSCV